MSYVTVLLLKKRIRLGRKGFDDYVKKYCLTVSFKLGALLVDTSVVVVAGHWLLVSGKDPQNGIRVAGLN